MIKGNSQSGFTLIELLISMAIAGVLLSLMVLAFTAQSRSYNTQQDISVLQEDMKSALQLMSRDIRMAGYDPTNAGSFGVLTPTSPLTLATVFTATEDLNGNGIVDAGETIKYYLSGGSLVRDANDGGGKQPVIDNVTNLAFEYLTMKNNGPSAAWTPGYTQVPADLKAIRAVKVCMQGRTARQTSSTKDASVYSPPIAGLGTWVPALAGNYQWRTMCIEVACRNIQ